MRIRTIIGEALIGTAGGVVAGVFLLLIGVIRAVVATIMGITVDWSTDAQLALGYVGAITAVGAVGRPLWVLAESKYAKLAAGMIAGSLGGVLIFRLVDSGEGPALPDFVGAIYGSLMGAAFWSAGRAKR